MHFLTHEILLFFTGVWTTNIHDCIHGKTWPIMGAGKRPEGGAGHTWCVIFPLNDAAIGRKFNLMPVIAA